MGDYNSSPDMNEMNMMKEIRARGPITIGLLVPLSMSYYESGIVTCDTLMPNPLEYTETELEVLRRIRDEFRMVEHLVSIVGWGETPKQEKYWIVRNTYCPDF